ncbi:hypothetical protein EV361DRAFT_956232 [Lentinula raphanica]|nr:hypothetical protein EV361DRAFT_956232 [Lentinula raphanica]
MLSLAPIDENDGVDLSRENMKIIDGWQTYHSFSPIPHASQASGSSSLTSVTTPRSSQEIDELRSQNITVSSPNTELVSPIAVLKESRMELPALPRSKRNVFGDRTSMTMKSKRIGAKQSYAAFLLDTLTNTKGKPLLSKDNSKQRIMLPLRMHMKKSKQETHIANESCSPSALHNDAEMRSSPIMDFDDPVLTQTHAAGATSSVTVNNEVSFAGQLGLILDGIDAADIESFASELHAILQSVDIESPLNMILREKLDLRSDGKGIFIEDESSLRRFVVPLSAAIKGGNEKDANKTYHQFVKKAKAIASLTLELSWVLFSTQTTALPTHTEILARDEFMDDTNTGVLNSATGINAEAKDPGGAMAESSGDLEPVTDTGPSQIEELFERWSRRADQVMLTMVFYPEGKIDHALSREERRRVKGIAIAAEHHLKLPSSSPSSPSPIPVLHWNTGSAPQAFVLTPDPTGTFSPAYHPELSSRAETGFGIPYHPDSLNGIQYRQDCHHDWS